MEASISINTALIFYGAIAIISFLIGYLIRKISAEGKINQAEKLAGKIISEAEKEADGKVKEAKLEARDELYQARIDFDKDSKERRNELSVLEKRLMQKEENIDRKGDF